MHPIFELLLARYCRDAGLDYDAVMAMTEGRKAITPSVVRMLEQALGVPPQAWAWKADDEVVPPGPPGATRRRNNKRVAVPERGVVVSSDGEGYARDVPTTMPHLAQPKSRRRRYGTAVHAVLDRLGWTIKTLAERVSADLGRPVSRASMQFYATGVRKEGPRGNSVHRTASAPLDVRVSAEKVTARESSVRKISPPAILPRSAWPNAGGN